MISRRIPIGALRYRIALTFFLGALVVSGFVAVATYGLARAYLTRQRTDSVLRQSFNTLRLAVEYLSGPQSRPEAEAVSLLQTRGTGDVVLATDERSLGSSLSVTLESIPTALRDAVSDGKVAYAVFGNPRRMAFGSHVPNTGSVAYLVYPLAELDATLNLLIRILLAVVAGTVTAAGLVGLRVAGATIEPLRRASEAAQRVAEGLLETGLENAGYDELGSLAESFNRMALALQERIARERRFVAYASHELRTPLTALKTSVDYLAQHASLPAPSAAAAKLAATEVRSLQRLIDDLLELSRIEAGSIEVRKESVEIGDFIHHLVHKRAAQADVSVSGPTERFTVVTDKHRLERVVGNILDNARVHGGGSPVAVRYHSRAGVVEILVSDEGPGIPPSELPRIFEPFWRGDPSRRRSAEVGYGLGLAIAQENAAAIGAELRVESEPGSGTTVTIALTKVAGAEGPPP